MKFIIKRSLLDQTLNYVSKGLSTKTPLPILTGIYIEATPSNLVFVATNKEITTKVDLQESDDLHIVSEGNCVVPGKFFIDIVKKIEEAELEITLFEENTMKIISNKSDFTLVAFEKDKFPKPNFELDGMHFQFTCKELKQMIKQTIFACSTNDNRLVLTSVNFLIKNNKVSVTATDSYRLARKEFEYDTPESMQMNIPSKSLEEFSKIINDSTEVVDIYAGYDKIIFAWRNILFLSRLVNGNYPDTSSLFSQNSVVSVEFNRNTLINAVDRASLFTDEDNLPIVKFTLNQNKKYIEISSNSTEIGRVVETIEPLRVSNNEDLQTAFSAKYLLDALKGFDTNEVTLHFTGEARPTIIRSESDVTLLQLLFPIRVF